MVSLQVVPAAEILRRLYDLILKFPRRHSTGTGTEDDHLDDAVRGGYRDISLVFQVMRCLHDVSVCCLRLFRIHNVHIGSVVNFPLTAANFVSIKDEDQVSAPGTLKSLKHLDQSVSRRIQIAGSELPEFLPGKNNVVPVNQKVIILSCFLPAGNMRLFLTA